jgi:hypothetical protein
MYFYAMPRHSICFSLLFYPPALFMHPLIFTPSVALGRFAAEGVKKANKASPVRQRG